MIKNLTQSQEQQLLEFKKECLLKGYRTDNIDKEKLIRDISILYKKIDKKIPYFWFCDSPFQIQIFINLLKWANLGNNLVANLEENLRENLWENLRENLRANLRENLWANLVANLGENLRENLDTNLGASLVENLTTNLRANLGINLGNNLWANLGNNLRNNLGANLGNNLEENLEANLRANLRDNLWDNLSTNLRENLGTNLRANLGDNLWDNLSTNLRENLGTNLRANLRANLGDNLWDNLRANLGDNLWANLWANLWENLWDNLRENLRDNKFEYFSTYFWGQFEFYWIAFYLFPEKYLGIKYTNNDSELLHIFEDISDNSIGFYPFENICFISERPIKIKTKLNDRQQYVLHCEDGSAIEFKDGYKQYYLNGVYVPKQLVETSANELNAKIILTEKNAEVRREIVRKIGIERIVAELDTKVLDVKGDYQLININIGDNRYRPYLKMKNPSIDVWHIEGVHPDCKSVDEALKWRNGTELQPIVLT